MVSKASEDLPEPDRPVKTTSLSRGISRSMFLRLCSRAPRMVIARVPDPAVCWRFALITSSIAAFPGALMAANVAAHRRKAGDRRQWVSSEHRKNARGFPVLRASHQRNVADWQQQAATPRSSQKKAGARPAFLSSGGSDHSVLRNYRAAPAV